MKGESGLSDLVIWSIQIRSRKIHCYPGILPNIFLVAAQINCGLIKCHSAYCYIVWFSKKQNLRWSKRCGFDTQLLDPFISLRVGAPHAPPPHLPQRREPRNGWKWKFVPGPWNQIPSTPRRCRKSRRDLVAWSICLDFVGGYIWHFHVDSTRRTYVYFCRYLLSDFSWFQGSPGFPSSALEYGPPHLSRFVPICVQYPFRIPWLLEATIWRQICGNTRKGTTKPWNSSLVLFFVLQHLAARFISGLRLVEMVIRSQHSSPTFDCK